jgi:DNA-binding response OmpR family regulator
VTTSLQPARSAIVVEDDQTILKLLGDLLKDAGFTTTCFTSGRPALATLGRSHADLLILDLGLPDMNGMRICSAAREQYGDDIAILIVTADNRRLRQIAALTLGADDVVPKPFDVDELLARIEAHVRRRLMRRAVAAAA